MKSYHDWHRPLDMDHYKFRRTYPMPPQYKRDDTPLGIVAIIVGVILFVGVWAGWL